MKVPHFLSAHLKPFNQVYWKDGSTAFGVRHAIDLHSGMTGNIHTIIIYLGRRYRTLQWREI